MVHLKLISPPKLTWNLSLSYLELAFISKLFNKVPIFSAESRRTGRHESEDRSIEYRTIAILSLSVNSEIRQIQHCATRGASSLTKYILESRERLRDYSRRRCRASPGVRRTWVYLSSGPRVRRTSLLIGTTRGNSFACVRKSRDSVKSTAQSHAVALPRTYVRRVHATRSRPHRALGETKFPRDITLDGGAYAAPCTPR